MYDPFPRDGLVMALSPDYNVHILPSMMTPASRDSFDIPYATKAVFP